MRPRPQAERDHGAAGHRQSRPPAPRRGGARTRAAASCATSPASPSAVSPACPRAAFWPPSQLRPADAALIQPAPLRRDFYRRRRRGRPYGGDAARLRPARRAGRRGRAGRYRTRHLAIIDGDTGEIILNPTLASLEAARRKARRTDARPTLSGPAAAPARHHARRHGGAIAGQSGAAVRTAR